MSAVKPPAKASESLSRHAPPPQNPLLNVRAEDGASFVFDAAWRQHIQRRLLAWLPATTRVALLQELHSCNTAAKPFPALPSQPSTQAGRATASRAPRTAAKSAAVVPPVTEGFVSLPTDTAAEAALTFLSLLLSPAVEHAVASQDVTHTNALVQLEVIAAVLLRCSRHHCRAPTAYVTGPAGARGGASLLTCVEAQAVVASLRLWTEFFLSFFLHQLHAERVRVAVLRATMSRLQQMRRPAHPAQHGLVKTALMQKQPHTEDAVLRRHMQWRSGHLVHDFAQHIRGGAQRILDNIDAASVTPAREFALCEGSTSKSRPSQAGQTTRSRQRQQMTCRSAHRQHRPAVKRRSRGVVVSRGRRRRASSSDSTPSASSASSTSSSTDTPSTQEGEEEIEGVKCTGPLCHRSDVLADDDVPLAALAAFLPPPPPPPPPHHS